MQTIAFSCMIVDEAIAQKPHGGGQIISAHMRQAGLQEGSESLHAPHLSVIQLWA
jgi:hypothetical protein